jgi:hypothetical protein
VARAQQPALPVIGYLSSGPPQPNNPDLAAFRTGLAEAGYFEGKNLAACRTEVYSMIANDSFVGANVHRTRDRAQSALLRSPIELASRCLGCI